MRVVDEHSLFLLLNPFLNGLNGWEVESTALNKQEEKKQRDQVIEEKIDIHPVLKTLLDHPMNLEAYKKKWGPSNSTGGKKSTAYHRPDVTGQFYRYMLFGKLRKELPSRPSGGDLFKKFIITVYKYGTEIGDFYDPNEELISVKCALDNPTLGDLNWYGKTRLELTNRYGEPQFEQNNGLIYYHDHKAISAHLENDRVRWFKYVRLHSRIDLKEKIPAILLDF